jgi:hypothetical protein
MSVLGLISVAANHLGLIRVVEVQDVAKPRKITTRSVTLTQLSTEVRAEQVRALSELPAELSVSFDKVFEAAGIKASPHGWTIPRLQQLLQTEQYKSMSREAAQQAILGLLAADKAPVEDLVQDAVQRDKSIDAFEGFVFKKMNARVEARQARDAQIEEQLRTLRQEQSRLAEETKADQERWDQWRQRKTAFEEELARAVGYVLEKPVVTIDRDPHPLRG